MGHLLEELKHSEGGSATLIANANRIGAVLGWRPERDGLAFAAASALAWKRRLAAR